MAFAIGLALAPNLATGAPLDPRELEARRDFAEARYEEALRLFAAMFAEVEDPIFVRNIARCYQKMKRPSEAIAAFHDYLARAHVSEKERREIASYIQEMEALEKERVAGAHERVPTPAAAAAAPTAASSNELIASGHAGAVPPATDSASTEATRTAPRSAAPPARVPPAPLAAPPTSEGDHGGLKWAGLATGTAGAALVAVGIGFGLAARSAEQAVELQYSEPRDADGRRDEKLQWLAFAAGGAALVTGAALFISGLRASSADGGSQLRAAVGPRGLGLEGHF